MELDQWLFGKAAKVLRQWSDSRKRRKESRQPFLRLLPGAATSYIGKFICLMYGFTPEIRTTPGQITLTAEYAGLPLEEPLTTSHVANRAFLLLAFVCMEDSGSDNLFRRIRKRIRDFAGFREIFSLIRLELLSIRKKSPGHYLKLLGILKNASGKISSDKPVAAIRAPETAHQHQNAKEQRQKTYDIQVKTENPEMLTPDQDAIEQYTLGHNFEKIETAEEFDGVWRDLDDNDDMEEHREALSDLKLRHLIRSDDIAHTTLESDERSGSGFLADDAETTADYWYDEWDFKKKAYRPEYCGVVAEVFQKQDPNFAGTAVFKTRRERQLLERRIVSLIQEKTVKRRLISGDDFDMDAMTERYADLKAGVTPGDRIYSRRTRLFSDIGLYILIDISLSTDSFLGGRRILDVEKHSLFAFAESLSKHDIPFGIGAFYSRTRNHCRFLRVKDFSDDFALVRNRLGAIEPVGYTRIGPALRHAGTVIEKQSARRRWVILITDGRPNDYDHYEGRYGIEDVHRAVSELKRSGTMVHTLAIGTEEKPAIPAMMRAASYRMLPDLSGLTDALGDFFRQAAR